MSKATVLTAASARSAQNAIAKYSSAATQMAGTVRIGPFTVQYSLTSSKASVTVSVAIGGFKKKLFSASLNLRKPKISKTISFGIFKASASVTVDFAKMQLVLALQVCSRKFPTGWNCKKWTKRIG